VETTCIQHAIRGGNVVALLRVEVSGVGPAFITYFRVEHHHRVDEWTRCSPEREQAVELYQRGVEDFIDPIPFVPAEVAP
jgi:hypothetical protein